VETPSKLPSSYLLFSCVGQYTFIGNGTGKGKKITFAEAWKGFEKSLTTARIPCHSVKRYPVVARWRNDVEYTAAGIYCFQPYCVTGELEPPANPLIQPQFCARFNDLDNIGITGRHYSGFIMLGNQVFNYPGDYKYFKDECLEFHHRWLTETLGIEPDEITYIEDVWAGGGNLGPSIEYFVRGLEVGNMVFMQYKTFHDGSREELQVKVIDVGAGLERIPWLVNGSSTSYTDVFKNALEYFTSKVEIEINDDIWSKFGPYSCQLNVDEIDHVDKIWEDISEKINMPVADVKAAIAPIKEMYIVLDHTRTLMMVIQDGSLPSNVGGGGNVRNILRRCFNILQKNGWWDKLGGLDGFLEIFKKHQIDLEGVYGDFPEYKSFKEIISEEHKRWQTTDEKQAASLQALIKKRKGQLTMADWIVCITSYGIPADKVAEISGTPVPGKLYYEMALLQEQVAKKPENILYSTAHLAETKNLYYENHHNYSFEA
jgi:alanyl-tRNA synthetase